MTPKPKFHHAGLNWIQHTPGDPMPCPPDTRVRVLLSWEKENRTHDEEVDSAEFWSWADAGRYSIIGWHPVEEQPRTEKGTMTHIELKERVGRAMRAMKKEPSAFLFIDGNTDWTCDLPEICGIPVLHGIDLRCLYADSFPEECPLVPLGATDGEIDFRNRKRFAEAWSE